jgi:hypothetical protein
MTSEHQYISRKNEGDRVIVFERGNLVFVFNFHWTNSYSDYRVGCLKPGKYKVFTVTFSNLFYMLAQVIKVMKIKKNKNKINSANCARPFVCSVLINLCLGMCKLSIQFSSVYRYLVNPQHFKTCNLVDASCCASLPQIFHFYL